MRLGAHESIAGGLHRAFEDARAVGCDAVQLFVKSNRAWAVKPLTEEEIRLFKAKAAETGIGPAVGHASYLLNPAAPDEDLWRRSRDTLIVELERCEALDIPYLVLHPGSHMGAGEEEGLRRVARALGEVHAATRGFRARILLETTAGQGTNLGYRFEQLAWLIENTLEGDRLGVCLDTCHAFAAGYELRTREGYEETLDALDRIIGLSRLLVIHLNDSKNRLGSRVDRHEHIGQGVLGLETFRMVVNDPRFADLPGLLETPKSEDLHEDRENLAVLRSLIQRSGS
ncbi:MAG: deoxyribonuclease IV [Anaerolineae bacterium]|nr:deoxyribonuclease IV [Anaerolineae bacterium]MDW8068701.1 deoxyribonuclease IV [Anaerolineae bacterium]